MVSYDVFCCDEFHCDVMCYVVLCCELMYCAVLRSSALCCVEKCAML